MIRVICPNCRAKLKAKDEWLGQTRKCPGCGCAVVISSAEEGDIPSPASEPSADAPAAPPADTEQVPLAHVEAPTRLERLNRYLICDPIRVIATWENNGQGWRIRTDFGFASAARSPEKIPNQGDFKLIELRMVLVGEELRLKGLRVYQLAQRWALTALGRGDDQICKSITAAGALVRTQKSAVRLHFQEVLMRSVWGDATEVLDYLANDDYHSSQAGP